MDVPFLKIACAAGVLSLLFVAYLARYVLAQPQGTDRMALLSRYVQEGALAFMKREYTWVFSIGLVVIALFTIAGIVRPDFGLSWKTGAAFAAGAIASACAGFLGMYIATRANSRTAAAAESGGVTAALAVAVSGGGVMGMGVVGIALIGLAVVYGVFKDMEIVNGYAMGASLIALFARSGGGIFTKGADMGADLVGKVEAGIPEDDPRNPAVIADNVGDNVGDVAGLGADLLESFVESIIACLAIAVLSSVTAHWFDGRRFQYLCNAFPFMVAAIGIVASVIGVMYVKIFASSNPQSALMMGTYISAGLSIIGVGGYAYLAGEGFFDLAGVDLRMVGTDRGLRHRYRRGRHRRLRASEYFTSSDYKPVKRLAKSCETGPATAVVEGTAVGMESTRIPIIILAGAVVAAFSFCGVYRCGGGRARHARHHRHGRRGGQPTVPSRTTPAVSPKWRTSIPKVREITDNLDSVGNTTAAIGKGFAIGSAAFRRHRPAQRFHGGRRRQLRTKCQTQ